MTVEKEVCKDDDNNQDEVGVTEDKSETTVEVKDGVVTITSYNVLIVVMPAEDLLYGNS